MKLAYIVLAALAVAAAPAAAQSVAPKGKICIDPHYSYRANYLSGHDIVAQQLLGHDHRQLRLSTTCIFLGSVDHIALASAFQCIDKGDDVFTSTIDGQRQSCRITHVEPYTPPATPG